MAVIARMSAMMQKPTAETVDRIESQRAVTVSASVHRADHDVYDEVKKVELELATAACRHCAVVAIDHFAERRGQSNLTKAASSPQSQSQGVFLR